jgi:pyruvate ferredoxin oxidoreductase alpha subunit
MKKCIEGSRAIAEAVNLCQPNVVATYPITPQTHIIEELAKMKANGESSFEYIRAESEFAAASMVLGASAAGVRTYTASSSQGLLLMTEVLFTIAGMRLPVVMTCANRAISAPINIWNDQQDAVTMRDSGWIMLYAEDNQEAADMHIVAFKVAEQLKLPVMVNMDGFVLTHTFEPVEIPEIEEIKKFLPEYSPEAGQYLDVMNPVSLGTFVTPDHYQEVREDLHDDLMNSGKVLELEFKNFKKQFGRGTETLIETYGDKKAGIVFLAMGSILGTIKETVDELKAEGKLARVVGLKCFRPFPSEELRSALDGATHVAVIDKSISLGSEGILALDAKAAMFGYSDAHMQSFVTGLGGRDITREKLKQIYETVQTKNPDVQFVQ